MKDQKPLSDESQKPANGSFEKPLQSWKEIAVYLDRSERTARRWEKAAGLPVHRLYEDKRSSVYAYPSELDSWRGERDSEVEGSRPARSLWRRVVLAATGIFVAAFVGWFVGFGPILNPPNPLVEAEGITIRQVWAEPKADNLGSPSPDGRYLSFVDWETGDLAIRDLETEENRRLTNKGTWSESDEFAMESVFSPDSKQLAYNWFNARGYDLRLVALDGLQPRILVQGDELAYIWPVDWSPDGREVLATIWLKDGTNQIALVRIDDSSVRVLKSMSGRFPRGMRLSPDGRYIAFDLLPHPEAEARDIYLLSTENKREIALVKHAANDLYPIWTPDGERIVFMSDRTGTLGLWSIQLKAGNPLRDPILIKADIGRFSPLNFTHEGTLYYALETGLFDVYKTRLDLSDGKILDKATPVSQRFIGFNLMPDWSPNGTHLAYLSRRSPWHANRSAGARIVIRDFKKGNEREVAPKLRSCTAPIWSPDGGSFLVRGQDPRGDYGVFELDARTGETTSIFKRKPETLERDLNWSRDGKGLFYRRYEIDKDRGFLIYRDLASGQETKIREAVPPENMTALSLSNDGKFLAFVLANYRTAVAAVQLITVTGENTRELLSVKKPVSIGALEWTPDDEEILVVKGVKASTEERAFQLIAVSIDEGKSRDLGPLMGRVHDLKLHPDGTSLAFTAGERKVEIWAMEGFLPES